MKRSDVESSWSFAGVVGIVLTILSPFIIIWILGAILPPPSEDSGLTPREAVQREEYESYKAEERAEKNGAQEACIDQMERDVERYGEQVIDTYDCTK